jgi:hypothetical protein
VQDHDAHIDKLQKQTEDKAEKGEVWYLAQISSLQ